MASLDTTILVDLLRRRSVFHARALAKMDQLAARAEPLATTRFTVAELQVGIELSDNPERDQADVDSLLADFEILDFQGAAARFYAQIRAEQRRQGRAVGDLDTLIAATALASGEHTLVTRNAAHFADIAGLTVEDY